VLPPDLKSFERRLEGRPSRLLPMVQHNFATDKLVQCLLAQPQSTSADFTKAIPPASIRLLFALQLM